MPRKAKKKIHRMPPLSFVDKFIYWTVFVLLCAADIALLFGPLWLRNVIAFADASVVASYDHASYLWALLTGLTFFLMTFILWLLPYEARRPIFGKRNFKYGPPAWPKVYPLFMKNKPYVFVSERKKKSRRQIAIILLVILVLSFIPWPWSLYGRDCLHYDGSIERYNMFNSQTDQYSAEQIEEVELKTYRYKNGRRSWAYHWGVSMKLSTQDGKEYQFASREFRKDSHWIAEMLAVKKQFDPGIISYKDTEKIDRVIWDKNLSPEETELLYELFGLG